MREMNTDEPLVEVLPIAIGIGNTVSERMSYMGFLISVAAVNRSWQHDTRNKGGMTRIQALPCNRGEPQLPERNHKVESPSRGLSGATVAVRPVHSSLLKPSESWA